MASCRCAQVRINIVCICVYTNTILWVFIRETVDYLSLLSTSMDVGALKIGHRRTTKNVKKGREHQRIRRFDYLIGFMAEKGQCRIRELWLFLINGVYLSSEETMLKVIFFLLFLLKTLKLKAAIFAIKNTISAFNFRTFWTFWILESTFKIIKQRKFSSYHESHLTFDLIIVQKLIQFTNSALFFVYAPQIFLTQFFHEFAEGK